jgi:hypothetical protein
MPTKPAALTRDQFALALARLNPLYAYRWTSATEYEWRGLQNPDGTYDDTAQVPTDQALTDAWAAAQADPASPIGKVAERDTAVTELGEQYADAITRLNQIIDFVGTPTAAQVYDAVQDIALYLRKTLRYLEAQR